uniref:Uncharacterized protein n=1 Tax=Kalanchoe fedtschenkoi TaxID=63787 RepID=A0A7N0ZYJ8_KALFE
MNRSFSTPPPALPVYQTKSTPQSSRTSLNLRHQASASWTAFGRSKTVGAARESYGGRSVRKIWNWGWGWMFNGSRSSKVEKAELGRPSRKSRGDLVQKARLRFRKLLVLDGNAGQPQTWRYNSFDYSKNFDDGSSKFYP